jgi:hypothetical protein
MQDGADITQEIADAAKRLRVMAPARTKNLGWPRVNT